MQEIHGSHRKFTERWLILFEVVCKARVCRFQAQGGDRMKRASAFAAAALGSALVFSGASSAFAADSGQNVAPSSTFSTSKGEANADAAAAAAADAARHVINQTFQDAVLKAKTEFDAAMKVATTAEAKASALAARRFSVSSAIAARQNALTALDKASKTDTTSKTDKPKR